MFKVPCKATALAEHLWNQCRLTDESVSWLCEELREVGVDIKYEKLTGEDPKQRAIQLVFICQRENVLETLAEILSGRDRQKIILQALRRKLTI